MRIPNQPTRGWTVSLPLKGSYQTVTGSNPRQVAYNASELYKLNGFQVDKNSLWFNLNLQWLERTPKKYRLRDLSYLMALAQANNVVNEDMHALKKTSPEEWTPGFWQFIAAYLDSQTYKWEVFLGFLKQYQKMLNPNENALLGDSNWYLRFTLALDKIERNPAYDAQKAKDWVNNEI